MLVPLSWKYFARKLVTFPGNWLTSVLFAERACNEDFAIWLAEQNVFAGLPTEK